MQEIASNKEHKQWNPYDLHGGTHVECVGQDFVAIAADTRMASNYRINTRHKCRIYEITSKSVIVGGGFEGDLDAFVTRMRFIAANYKQQHFKEMSVDALARSVANILYSKRFFPYYVMISVCGIDDFGHGKLYSYDQVGCIEDIKYAADGSGNVMAMPILDHYFGSVRHNTKPYKYPTQEEAKNLLREVICSVAERDIETGDYVEVAILDANGLHTEKFDLPKH